MWGLNLNLSQVKPESTTLMNMKIVSFSQLQNFFLVEEGSYFSDH